ncbi:YD repeat-containing protein, partial [Alteromonadaceae bacterium 2753L.S.0a.02]
SGITSVKSSVALDYSYDALGRLEEVKEDNAAIIAYCYDAAGNRYNVVHNAGSDSCPDEPAPQLPAIVTGLSISSSQGGGYVVSWSPVSDAIWYEVNLPAPDAAFPNQQPPIRIDSPQTTMTTSTQRPINVRACNYYGCSIDASAF